MSNRFSAITVFITGATSGIGRATALAFASEGARVTLVARNESRLREVCDQCNQLSPSSAIAIPADVSVSSSLATAVQKSIQQWGRLDILLNNAGIGHNLPFEHLGHEQTEQIIRTNFHGTLYGVESALPQMKQQPPISIGGHSLRGQIIIISSVVAYRGIPQLSVYSATKAAQKSFSEALRHELRRDAIEVICICPGTTDTEFFQNSFSDGRPQLRQRSRMMSAGRVAHAILNASFHHRKEVALTFQGKLFKWSNRLAPWLTDWGMGLVYDAYQRKRNESGAS